MTFGPLNVDLPDAIPGLYDTLKTYTVGSAWPSQVYLPFTPTQVVKNSGATLTDVAASSGDTISVDSSIGVVRDLFLLAHGHKSGGDHDGTININSDSQAGDADYCDTGEGWARMFASKDLTVGSNAHIAGAQLVAGLNLYLGSDGVSMTGIAAQVGTTYYAANSDPKIEPASSSVYGGCNAHFIPGAEVIALKY